MSAIFAGPQLLGAIEFLKHWLHLGGDIGHEKVLLIDFGATFWTIPKQAIGHAGLPDLLDDKPDSIGFALR